MTTKAVIQGMAAPVVGVLVAAPSTSPPAPEPPVHAVFAAAARTVVSSAPVAATTARVGRKIARTPRRRRQKASNPMVPAAAPISTAGPTGDSGRTTVGQSVAVAASARTGARIAAPVRARATAIPTWAGGRRAERRLDGDRRPGSHERGVMAITGGSAPFPATSTDGDAIVMRLASSVYSAPDPIFGGYRLSRRDVPRRRWRRSGSPESPPLGARPW